MYKVPGDFERNKKGLQSADTRKQFFAKNVLSCY
jgi:hypothetical protein